jgi:hypothetical protein
VQDLPDPVTVTLRVRDGRSVETQTYRRAYFPLSPGVIQVPPAHLHYELRRGFLQPPETRRVSSDSVRLVVRPLPETGRPPSFNGAVGRFQMLATVAPARVAVGEAALLTVQLTGVGNVRALPEPRLPQLEHVEVFDPTQSANVSVNADVVGGTMRFQWMIVPVRARTVVIPPVEYSYFDPELRSYITLRSDSLTLEAVPLVAGAAPDTALRPLRGHASHGADWAKRSWFAAVQAVPLLLVGLIAALRRRRDRPPGPAQHAARIRAQLNALRGAGAAALPEVERLVKEAVRTVAGVSGLDCAAALRGSGMHDAANEFTAVTADVQRARFAPDAHVDPHEIMDRAERLVDALVPPRVGPSPVLVAVAGIACLCIIAAGLALQAASRASAADQSGVQQDAEALFADAVALHVAGDYAAAANAFHAYAHMRPADASGWYNHGLLP